MKGRNSSLPLSSFFLGEKQATNFVHLNIFLISWTEEDLLICSSVKGLKTHLDKCGRAECIGCLKVPCPEGKMNICIECKALFRQSRERHMSGTQHNLSDT